MVRSRFLLIIIGLILTSCSGNNESDKVDISFSPETPIVINSDFTFTLYVETDGTPVQKTVEGPWFLVKYQVNNGASKQVVLQSLKFKAKIATTTGQAETEVDFSSTDLVVNNNSVATDDLPYIDSVNSGRTGTEQSIYIGGLGVSANTNYSVSVTAEGWFGGVFSPEAPYKQQFFFTTQ